MPVIKVQELAYIRMQVPDLEVAERFYTAFGLLVQARDPKRLYMRAYGPEAHVMVFHKGAERRLISIAYSVARPEDLARMSTIEGASPVHMLEEPGGGQCVTIRDVDGTMIELVHGLAGVDPIATEGHDLNTGIARNRRLNAVVRPARHPARILRIGHVVLRTPDVARSARWYRETLGFLDSDDVPSDDGESLLMSFMRLDHGAEFVDHHVLQMFVGPASHIHHISFEVPGIDDLHIGHEVLADAGYEHVWGIGRHLQGSQIFDYWLDPFGVMCEHWTDTDLLDAGAPKGVVRRSEMHGAWGGAPPSNFGTHATA